MTSLSACSSAKKKVENVAIAPATEATSTPIASSSVANSNVSEQPAMTITPDSSSEPELAANAAASMADHTEMPNDVHHAEAKSKHHKAPVGVSAEKALGWLKNGNKRFLKKGWRKDGASKADITRLAKGQSPHTIVLSCSDSRVPPEIVFDQKLGEIFVVRTAGEVLEPGSIASIEYAVAHLGTNLILVMGHTSCGAVGAALDTLNGADAGSSNLNTLVDLIHPYLQKFQGKKRSSDLSPESWANTKGAADYLVSKSMIVRDKVNSGELQIQTALYNLKTGAVDFGH